MAPQVSARARSPRAFGPPRELPEGRMQEPPKPHALPRPSGPTRFRPSFQSPVPIRGRPCAPIARLRSSARAQCSNSVAPSPDTVGSKYRSQRVVPCEEVSIWNRSTSRRAPTSPSHAGRRLVLARRMRASSGMPGSRSVTRTRKTCGVVSPEHEVYLPSLGVPVGVPRYLGRGRRQPRLILDVEAQRRAMVRERCRARTTSPLSRIVTAQRRGRLMRSTAVPPPR